MEIFDPVLRGRRAEPGSYRVVLAVDGVEQSVELRVRADPLLTSDGEAELMGWIPDN